MGITSFDNEVKNLGMMVQSHGINPSASMRKKKISGGEPGATHSNDLKRNTIRVAGQWWLTLLIPALRRQYQKGSLGV